MDDIAVGLAQMGEPQTGRVIAFISLNCFPSGVTALCFNPTTLAWPPDVLLPYILGLFLLVIRLTFLVI